MRCNELLDRRFSLSLFPSLDRWPADFAVGGRHFGWAYLVLAIVVDYCYYCCAVVITRRTSASLRSHRDLHRETHKDRSIQTKRAPMLEALSVGVFDCDDAYDDDTDIDADDDCYHYYRVDC